MHRSVVVLEARTAFGIQKTRLAGYKFQGGNQNDLSQIFAAFSQHCNIICLF